jgi:stage II sporulation protein D
MLKPNIIPVKEPEIRVGIILPEDKYERIIISIPQEYPCTLEDARKESASLSGIFLNFLKSDQLIFLNKFEKSTCWHMIPENQHLLSQKTGIIVENAVTGRGFHWQKQIDLYLPGRVEIVIKEGHLMLINTLSLEQYIACVATSEMSAACPEAFLQAQTIAARSWLLANIEQKHIKLDIDVCNDDCCQRYQGSGNLTDQAIAVSKITSGQVLMHQKKICDCRYSKSCGGIMESYATIWHGSDKPYLQAKPDAPENRHNTIPVLDSEENVKRWIDTSTPCYCSPVFIPDQNLITYLGSVDENAQYYRWQIRQTHSEMVQSLNRVLKLNIKKILTFTPLSRGLSGRINKLKIEYQDLDDKKMVYVITGEFLIRKSLYKGFLYSSCFYVEKEDQDDRMIIKGAGWGHGVGLCQIGALGMALQGIPCEKILNHYYPGTQLFKIY